MHFAPNEIGFARVGLAVSRRVDKKSVARHRIKRQIRESFRHKRRELSAMDYVVVAKPGAGAQPNRTLRGEIDALWARAAAK